MSDVFLAGPIDFHEIGDLAAYRLRMKRAVEAAGHTPVDQYSEALDVVTDDDDEVDVTAVAADVGRLPSEPYLDAIGEAVAATSMETVLSDPSVVPDHTSEATVERMVERDLELLGRADAILAYLPAPSCGTTVEIVRAADDGLPVVVAADRAPHFVRYFADRVTATVEDGVDAVDTLLADATAE